MITFPFACNPVSCRQNCLAVFAMAAAWLLCLESGWGQSLGMVEVPYRDKVYVGQPLAWDGSDLMLHRRDGRISRLPAEDPNRLTIVADQFEPYSSQELRGKLKQEFGSKYQVSVTNDFVVVHPPGSKSKWADPFQELFLRFGVFFESRGVKLERPKTKMVAIVLRTRREYDRFIDRYHSTLGNTLGYYNPSSNRIITYDHSDDSREWLDSSETIVHEATHQTAYNTGIHRRFANAPRWATEGLAQLFEAKGINNSQYYSKLSDRVNYGRLRQLKAMYRSGQVAGQIESLVSSDSLFRSDPQLAYAVSWGVSFFLSESYPSQYAKFLAADGGRQPFRSYTRTERTRDFAKAFGSSFREMESRMELFFDELSVSQR